MSPQSVWRASTLVPTSASNGLNGCPWGESGMAWFGWALAALGFMGLANLGMRAAGFAVGTMNTTALLVNPQVLLSFRERLQPTRLMGLAATPSGPCRLAR